jgi:hypothetical protein
VGVFGKSANGEGVHGETTSTTAAAVASFNLLRNGTGAGVFGMSVGRGPAGFFTTNGLGMGAGGEGDAVLAISGALGNAIHAIGGNFPAPNMAGLFEGAVEIDGSLVVNKVGGLHGDITADSIRANSINANSLFAENLVANSKHFRVDHPLDPANKYLIHATVESSERLNLYSGIALLDDDGQAEVVLPEWFDALNGDFRYQLTCIGGFAPVYIAAKVSGNRFSIGGGYAGLEVSWQIAGRRQDRWAREHPFMVVEDKPVGERVSSNRAHSPEGLSFRS